MMKVGGTNIGQTIRVLREAKGMTRSRLSEEVGISESHLKKIETGIRQPGIHTYQKIIDKLGVDMVISSKEKTIKGICIEKAQDILLNSTDEQAVFLIKLLEFMVQNKELLIREERI